MPKFPEPPAVDELVQLGPEVKVLPAGHRLWRVYFAAGPHPVEWNTFRRFGPVDARFDHHLPPPAVQDRGILYCADLGPTCLAEVFQASRTVDRRTRSPWLVCFELSRDVPTLDLTGAWPTRAGASTAIHSGPRARARRWAQAVYQAFPALQGITYASSMDANRTAHAFTERAEGGLKPLPVFHRALADPSLTRVLDAAAQRFGYVVV